MDNEQTQAPSANVTLPASLFHRMAACFYGKGPTFAQLTGMDEEDEVQLPADDMDGGSENDMDDEPPFHMGSVIKVTSYGVGAKADDNGVS